MNNFKGKPGPGRPKGMPNKMTVMAKAVIEEAFEKMGGVDALVKWATSSEEAQKAFYATIYPRLLPLQVTGQDGGDIGVVTTIRREIVNP